MGSTNTEAKWGTNAEVGQGQSGILTFAVSVSFIVSGTLVLARIQKPKMISDKIK